MIEFLVQADVQSFIKENLGSKVEALALQKDFPYPEYRELLLTQIALRQRSAKKLPLFYHHTELYIPHQLAVEQCSSELTASYKTKYFPAKRVFDINAGLGVDSLHYALAGAEIHLAEIDTELQKAHEHNFACLNLNCSIHKGDGVTALTSENQTFDLIYTDPSRRAGEKRVYSLEGMQPNVLEGFEEILQKGSALLIKAAPMIDLNQTATQLGDYLHEIHVLSVGDECKEVLFLCKPVKRMDELKIQSAHYDGEHWKLFTSQELNPIEQTTYTEEANYLHIPYPALMKSFAFRTIHKHFPVQKLATNTHVYFSDQELQSFPGKSYEILDTDKLRKSSLTKGENAQLILRNAGIELNPALKKLGLKSGGNKLFLIGRNQENKSRLFQLKELKN